MANSTPTTPAPYERTEVQALFHQWKTEKARMDLALLEDDGGDEEGNRIMDEGRAKLREIEETILNIEPEAFTDNDGGVRPRSRDPRAGQALGPGE